LAAKPTDEKSSSVFKRDYERTADDFCGKYVIAHYQPRQMRGLESRVGWYVGEGIFYLLSQTCIHSCSVPFAGLFAGLKLAGLGPAKCHAESPTKKIAPQKSKLGLPNSSQLIQVFRTLFRWYQRNFNHDMARQKSPKHKLGGVWESEFEFLRGNSFCEALRVAFCGA